ncbi:NAD(P)-dependent oxidoreductase [Kibdelosporangium aridum]|uniref:NAD(P)-dependent oxidoreductase n=1 Tax=Kibdelosporangium aridum TaxID=2030 RepID=A0A428ZNR8_KIBAR|nr:NAD(P)-dependent oxidoreductase [Kibdelosporangium aridum]
MIGANPRAKAIANALDPVVGQADLVVVCAEDYSAVPDVPAGPDIVNLTSGTTEEAIEAAKRFPGRYLDGALMAHPEHVGRAETVLVYSGSPEVFARHEKPLPGLVRPRTSGRIQRRHRSTTRRC